AHWYSYTRTMVPLEEMRQEAKQGGSGDGPTIGGNIDYHLRDQLCRALRINTPLRRDLFTAMFVCTNYLDAAGKLISIGKKRFSEVVNVVLHVAINEKTYNQFYHYLL